MATNVAPLVCWDVVKRTSSFRRTSTHNKFVTMSSEAMNLEGAHSYRASGLAQSVRVGIVPTAAGKVDDTNSGYEIVTFDAALAKSPKLSRKASELALALKKGADHVMSQAIFNKPADAKAGPKARVDLLQQALAKYSRVRKAGKVKVVAKTGVKSGSRKDRAAAMRA